MRVGIIRGATGESHSNGRGHPERPERTRAIETVLDSAAYAGLLENVTARIATHDEACLAHSEDYLDKLAASRNRDLTIFDLDTSANAHSYDAALLAAGGAITAVENALAGETSQWFVPVRPPGHHAERGAAMGFCLLNNVAIAAAAAVANMGLHRIAIVDWDVHHGNGTQHIFSQRSDVLYLSLHQYPHYPGTGAVDEVGSGSGAGYTVNIPLPSGSSDADYEAAFARVVVPILDQYAPEVLLVSAGFDAHERDPLSSMRLSDGGFASMTRALQQVAATHADGRIVFVLEGGYDLEGLQGGVRAMIDSLLGPDTGDVASGDVPSAANRAVSAAIDQAIRYLSPHWEL